MCETCQVWGRRKTYIKIAIAMRTPVVFLNDNNYYLCQLDELRTFQNSMPEIPYRRDIGDCDNYAFALKGIADSKTNAVGIIIGKHKGEAHAWNIALTVSGIWQIEPQTDLIFKKYADYQPMIVLI